MNNIFRCIVSNSYKSVYIYAVTCYFWIAFFRHLGYLGVIIFLTSICYCAGIVITCRQRGKFQSLPQDDPSTGEIE